MCFVRFMYFSIQACSVAEKAKADPIFRLQVGSDKTSSELEKLCLNEAGSIWMEISKCVLTLLLSHQKRRKDRSNIAIYIYIYMYISIFVTDPPRSA